MPCSSMSGISSSTDLPVSRTGFRSTAAPTRSGYSASMERMRSSAIPAMTSGSWIDLAMWWMK